MKKFLLSTFGFLLSSFLFSQNSYPLYSDVWKFSPTNIFDKNGYTVLPKDGEYFQLMSNYYINNVDTNLVKQYLLSSFNKFRNDYGRPPVIENKTLTKISSDYSLLMSYLPTDEWVHSDLENHIFYLSGNYVAEVMSGIDNMMFNNLNKSYGDLNKIVADCIFDIFIISQKHSDILLRNTTNYEVGFGVTFSDWGIMIIIQLTENKK